MENTYVKKEGQIVNDPYADFLFLPGIDKKSGFITKNMLTVPIFSKLCKRKFRNSFNVR